MLARVLSPESGYMKSELSVSDDIFVPLDWSYKMLIVSLWDLNSSM